MHADHLLAHVLRDLRARLDAADDEYQILRASGLLRLMLLDRDPLLVAVARAYDYPLEFEVSQTRLIAVEAAAGGMVAQYPGLSPRVAGRGQTLSLQEFLAHPVINVVTESTTDFSVKTVIRAAAISFGGVHFMNPDRPEDQELARLARLFDPTSGHHIAMTLLGVGHVTMNACAVLLDRLEACGH